MDIQQMEVLSVSGSKADPFWSVTSVYACKMCECIKYVDSSVLLDEMGNECERKVIDLSTYIEHNHMFGCRDV